MIIRDQKVQANRVKLLDSLRGIAAMIVLYHHFFKLNTSFFEETFGPNIKFLYALSELNREAVLFFFVLSGFSIALSLRGRDILEVDNLNLYIYRRLKRILPLYFLALFFALIVGKLMSTTGAEDFSVYNLFGNLLFLQTGETSDGWFTPYGYNGPLWSLAYEFFFYCLFPAAVFMNRKYFSQHQALIKFMLLLVLTVGALFVNRVIFIPHFAFFSYFVIWVVGYLCGTTFVSGRRYDRLFFISLLLSLLYLTVGINFLPSNSMVGISEGLLIASSFYLVLSVVENMWVLKLSRWPVKVLNHLFYTIGKGSYSIYVLHYPLLLLLNHYSVPVAFQLVLICCSVWIFIIVEEWTLRWSYSILNRRYLKTV